MKAKSFIKATFLFMLCVNFVACSDDEDEKDSLKDNSENEVVNKLTAEEQLLVGEWISDGGNPLDLYSDMSCYTPDRKSGTYSYNPQTKELITTSGWGIRIVKSLDEKTMVLQGVQTSKVWTYNRQKTFIDKQYKKLLIGTWERIDSQKKTVTFINSDTFDFGMGDFYYEIKTGGKFSDGTEYIYVDADDAREPDYGDGYGLYIQHIDCNTMIVHGSGVSNDGTYKRVK